MALDTVFAFFAVLFAAKPFLVTRKTLRRRQGMVPVVAKGTGQVAMPPLCGGQFGRHLGMAGLTGLAWHLLRDADPGGGVGGMTKEALGHVLPIEMG